MSRMVDYMISLANGRDDVWDKMSDSQRERWAFLFGDFATDTAPTIEFDEHFPQCKLYTLLEIQTNQAMMVAHHNKETRLKRTVYAMVYSHSVTLLESFIGDSLIALVKCHPQILQGLATHYDEVKNTKMTFAQIINLPDGIKGKIISLLQNDTFHNLGTIDNIFQKAFGVFGKGIDTNSLGPIISRRHDIVHRNGMSPTGERLMLELDFLETDIKTIMKFAGDLLNRMNSAVTNF